MLVIEAVKEMARVASLRYSYISICGRQCGFNGFMGLFQEQQSLDFDLLLEISEGVSWYFVHLSSVLPAWEHTDVGAWGCIRTPRCDKYTREKTGSRACFVGGGILCNKPI